VKHHLFELYKLFVERFFRVRTLGSWLLKAGLGLLMVLLGADFAGRAALKFGDFFVNIEGSTGSSLPGYIVYTAFIVASLLVVAGGLLMWRDEQRERQRLLVVIEVRGLHNSPDAPARNAIRPSFRGQRHSVLVDFRPSLVGELVNPELMLAKIRGMKLNLESAVQGRDMSDVSLAVGGVAAVPGMFYIGMRLDDESRLELFDWNRDLKNWKAIDGIDDGNRPLPLSILPIPFGLSEVVLAVSASYIVDESAVAASFPGLPVVRLSAEKIQANSYWSEEVQQAFAAAFRNTVQELLGRHIKRIHLVLAAPASLTVRLGATYDERLHPELVAYQYERSSTPPYPWGIVLPHHGSPEPVVLRTPPTIA
jgi:hypothetical protein